MMLADSLKATHFFLSTPIVAPIRYSNEFFGTDLMYHTPHNDMNDVVKDQCNLRKASISID